MANDYRIEADYHARSVAGSKKIQQMWLELAKKREDQANDPNETREAGVYSEELRNFFRRSAAEASRKADIEGAGSLSRSFAAEVRTRRWPPLGDRPSRSAGTS